MLGNRQSHIGKPPSRLLLISISDFIHPYCSEGNFKEKLSSSFISYPSDIESIVCRIYNWGYCDKFIIFQ